MRSLNYPLAVFNEAIRLYSPVRLPILPEIEFSKALLHRQVAIFPRVAAQDTTSPAMGPDGNIVSLPTLQGTVVYIDSYGLHYNSKDS